MKATKEEKSLLPAAQSQRKEYLFLEIQSAHLTKRVEKLWSKLNPFVELVVHDEGKGSAASSTTMVNVTPTYWDAHFDPQWFHSCPGILLSDDPLEQKRQLIFTACHESELNKYRTLANAAKTEPKRIGRATISIQELIERVQESKMGSLSRVLGTKSPVRLELNDIRNDDSESVGTLQLQIQIKRASPVEEWLLNSSSDKDNSKRISHRDSAVTRVDPTWFECPVQRVEVSGGTAPFFRLTLTEKGLKECQKRYSGDKSHIDKDYWIGKDLSHAQDERGFYETMLQMKNAEKLRRSTIVESDQSDEIDLLPLKDVSLLSPFMFDYLGVLETETTEEDKGKDCQLLVMHNLRNRYSNFRLLDLKVGQKTAQGGWKGKSRLKALKHHLMDGLSNSALEGFRLAGFNGCPELFASLDPLIDLLVIAADNDEQSSQGSTSSSLSSSTADEGRKTSLDSIKAFLGTRVKESHKKTAKRIMLNSLTGGEIFHFFLDVHNESEPSETSHYRPIETVEIVLDELVSQLVRLAVTCHQVRVPQKWVGSSVAIGYDAGFFPKRSVDGEQAIRSKVTVNIFDWGRSELLAEPEYQCMSSTGKSDRQLFWKNYKIGIDNLAYNVARAYFHQFANTTRWTHLTLKVMDFDSMSADDHIGTVTISLPDPLDASSHDALNQSQSYKIEGVEASKCGSKLNFSISWSTFPKESRLSGAWSVTVDRATNLPSMDRGSHTSDPYCLIIAYDDINQRSGRELRQMTCVKARCLNPVWNETLTLPIFKPQHGDSLAASLEAQGLPSLTEHEMLKMFQWNDTNGDSNKSFWSKIVSEAGS